MVTLDYLYTGGRMCLCDHPDGRLLVHRSASSGRDGAPPGAPFPSLWHHAVKRCEFWRTSALSERFLHAHCMSCLLCGPAIPGVYAVPERHQHAFCGGSDGRGGRGTLEPSQTHRAEGAAFCRSASSTVSGSHTHNHLSELFYSFFHFNVTVCIFPAA